MRYVPFVRCSIEIDLFTDFGEASHGITLDIIQIIVLVEVSSTDPW